MPSLFYGVYQALYDYEARTEDELTFQEGNLLYLLEKSSTDDWLRAKKSGPAGSNEAGLVPVTYIEPAPVKRKAYALYDYDKQTEEELTFQEGDSLVVYDDSDPQWLLVCRGEDEYGFAPGNYVGDQAPTTPVAPVAAFTSHVSPPAVKDAPLPPLPDQSQARPLAPQATVDPVYANRDYDDEREESPPPPMPPRPGSSGRPAMSSSANRQSSENVSSDFFSWPVQEVDGRKKRKATLAIGNGMIMFSPERSSGQPQQWPIKDLVNYNSEKKHVFLDFKHPTMSFDLHLGSKDTADEVIYALGDLVGAYNSSGLTEVIVAANSAGQKLGKVLYKFEAQSRDEVSVDEGENVFIIDDTKSRDWWMVKNSSGIAGVVPSSYIEVAPTEKAMKKVAESQKKTGRDRERDRSRERDRRRDRSRDKDRTRTHDAPKSKPDSRKLRTWTDRSGSFKVDAVLLGCVEGKIHLHKANGVKIAVACSKMSLADLEYVEDVMGVDLEEDKPLSRERSTRKSSRGGDRRKSENVGASSRSSGVVSSSKATTSSSSKAANTPNAAPAPGPAAPEYDWFGFFLDCGVDVHACQRYTTAFNRDQMDESILSEVTPSTLRSLGLKEGDILRVCKKLDEKFGRNGGAAATSSGAPTAPAPNSSGGLFSDTTGALKNNTSKTLLKADDGDPWSALDATPAPKPQSEKPSQQQSVVDSAQQTPTPPPPVQKAQQPVPATPAQQTPVQVLQPVASVSSIKPLQPTPTAANLQTQTTGGVPAMVQQPMMSHSTSSLPQTTMLPQVTGPLQQSLTGAAPVQNPFLTGGPNTVSSLGAVPTGYSAQAVLGMNNPVAVPAADASSYSMNAITNALAASSLNKQQQQFQQQPIVQQLTGGSLYGQQPVQQQLTGGNVFAQQPFTQATQQPVSQQLTGGSLFSTQVQPVQPFQVQQPFQQAQPFQSQPFHQMQQQQPFVTGSMSPFGQPSPTPFVQPQQSTGVNYFNIQPLQQPFGQIQQQQPFVQQPAMQVGLQSQPTGFGFGNSSFGSNGMQSAQTGVPATSFGQQPLQPTTTGRQRANLASATPNNPFGF